MTCISDVHTNRAVELVLTNYPAMLNDFNETDIESSHPAYLHGHGFRDIESSHPVHLHGRGFYVVKIGYPEYNESGYYLSPNPDITCIVDATNETCERFITVTGEHAQTVKWTNDTPPEDLHFRNKCLVPKDTVIVPFGGYTVIRFLADNPGWWLIHCHIEIHQLEGMAAVVKEGSSGKQH